jgi:hypothetical protein
MPKFKVVGWYAKDPTDGSTPPESFTTEVQAENRHHAFDVGEFALLEAVGPERSEQLMNWYVQEITS